MWLQSVSFEAGARGVPVADSVIGPGCVSVWPSSVASDGLKCLHFVVASDLVGMDGISLSDRLVFTAFSGGNYFARSRSFY